MIASTGKRSIIDRMVGAALLEPEAYQETAMVPTNRFGVPRTAANWGATWRTLALASSPRVFLVLTFVPAVGFLVGLAVYAWVLITTVLAVREALDLKIRPAIATALIGLLPMLLLWALVAALV